MKVHTWSDIEKYLESEEGKAESRALEGSYRDGYFDGVKATLEYLSSDSDGRQLNNWLWGKLFDWRYRSDFDELVYPPQLTPWPELRIQILERDKHTCQYCGLHATHVDHVVPVCQGGGYEEDNLVAACASCNLKKGKKTPEQAGMKLTRNS